MIIDCVGAGLRDMIQQAALYSTTYWCSVWAAAVVLNIYLSIPVGATLSLLVFATYMIGPAIL